MADKLVIFSAPSGSGKTTIVNKLLKEFPSLEFSVSATSRAPRKGELDGREYWFISPEEFRTRINKKEFVEWEEVYPGLYYGTLKSELERIWSKNKHVIFDVDVLGGISLKKQFKGKALSVFIKVPSLEELAKRLKARSTDSEELIQKRLSKAGEEMQYQNKFDVAIINDDLDKAVGDAVKVVRNFLND